VRRILTVIRRSTTPLPDSMEVMDKTLDPERGAQVAEKLRVLGVSGTLLNAAEEGYITELECQMPTCMCPEQCGGRGYFEVVNADLSDWMPTHEHFPRSQATGRHRTVDNALLAHRLCNRIDYSRSINRPHEKDLQRVEAAREACIRRNAE
jgi:hypothetical protein